MVMCRAISIEETTTSKRQDYEIINSNGKGVIFSLITLYTVTPKFQLFVNHKPLAYCNTFLEVLDYYQDTIDLVEMYE